MTRSITVGFAANSPSFLAVAAGERFDKFAAAHGVVVAELNMEGSLRVGDAQ